MIPYLVKATELKEDATNAAQQTETKAKEIVHNVQGLNCIIKYF